MATQSHSLQYRGVTVQFEKGDVSRRNDDALAMSCDLTMALNSPLCAAFVRLGGQRLKASAMQEVARHPELYQNPPTPVAICVPAHGQLQCRHVIFIPMNSTFGNLIPQAMTEMLNSAIQCGAQSLAFPAIGTGGYRLLDHFGFCQALLDALRAVPNFGTLQHLTLVTTNDYWTDQYYFEFRDLVAAQQQAGQANPPAPQQVNPPPPALDPITLANVLGNQSFLNPPHIIPVPNPYLVQAFHNAFSAMSPAFVAQVVQNLPPALVQNFPYTQNFPATQNAQQAPAPSQNQSSPFSSAYTVFDKKMVQELRSERLKEKEAAASSSNANVEDDDRLEACPVCLNDMLDDVDNYDENSDTTIVQTVQCSHKFHRDCLTEWFKNKASCPVCSTPCMEIQGNQPIGGTMTCLDLPGDVDGYPGIGHIQITYSFPPGIQTSEHPNPGAYHGGTTRTCFLPNNAEGRKVRDLLRIAFTRRLIFTVGQSVTTGQNNVITWNGIHHKTNRRGGAARYGYPDPTYLQRVQEELALYGITESLLD